VAIGIYSILYPHKKRERWEEGRKEKIRKKGKRKIRKKERKI